LIVKGDRNSFGLMAQVGERFVDFLTTNSLLGTNILLPTKENNLNKCLIQFRIGTSIYHLLIRSSRVPFVQNLTLTARAL